MTSNEPVSRIYFLCGFHYYVLTFFKTERQFILKIMSLLAESDDVELCRRKDAEKFTDCDAAMLADLFKRVLPKLLKLTRPDIQKPSRTLLTDMGIDPDDEEE